MLGRCDMQEAGTKELWPQEVPRSGKVFILDILFMFDVRFV